MESHEEDVRSPDVADESPPNPHKVSTTAESDSGRLARIKDIASIMQSVFTVAAIIAAGWWFWFGRQNEPRIRIDQSVTHFRTSGESGSAVAAVEVKVTNTGNVLVNLNDGHVDVDSIAADPVNLDTRKLSGFVLEPGEQEQVYFENLDIPNNVWAVQVYARFPSPNHLSWHLASAFNLKSEDKAEQKATLTGSIATTAGATTVTK